MVSGGFPADVGELPETSAAGAQGPGKGDTPRLPSLPMRGPRSRRPAPLPATASLLLAWPQKQGPERWVHLAVLSVAAANTELGHPEPLLPGSAALGRCDRWAPHSHQLTIESPALEESLFFTCPTKGFIQQRNTDKAGRSNRGYEASEEMIVRRSSTLWGLLGTKSFCVPRFLITGK